MTNNIEVLAYEYELEHPNATIQQAFIDGYYRKNKQTLIKAEIDMSIVPPILLPTVEKWLAYKKEKKQSYKPIGFRGFVKQLIDYSNGNVQLANEIINKSIGNNYSGIFRLTNYDKRNFNSERKEGVDRLKELATRVLQQS